MHTLSNDKYMGLGLTRNRGIEESRDDYVAKDYVESYYSEMIKDPSIDVVVGGYIKDREGKLKRHPQKDCVWSVITYPIACAKMFRKSFLTENSLYFTDIRMAEDVLFSLDAYCCGYNYKVLDYCGYCYYLNRDSITGNVKKQRNQEVFVSEIFDRLMEKHDLNKLPLNDYYIVEYAYLANMVNALMVYSRGANKKERANKLDYVWEDASRRFPDFCNNPYIHLFAPKGQTLKIRFGVWVMLRAYKLKLDGFVTAIASKL